MCLVSLINEHNWCMNDYQRILEDWIKIVFNLIDLFDSVSRGHLIKWISSDQVTPWETYEICFNNEVSYYCSLIH